jgi:hypothetical protein
MVKRATRPAEPRRRIALWAFVAALVLCGLLTIRWRVRVAVDPAPAPADDLVPRGVELADEDNAFALLEQAYTTGRDDDLDTKAEDRFAREDRAGAATRARYMRARTGALPLVQKALARRGLALPPATTEKPYPVALPGAVARFLEVASAACSDTSDEAGALDRLLELARLGRLFQGSESSFALYQRGLLIEENALGGIRRVAVDARPIEATKLAATRKALERLEPDTDEAAEVVKADYQAYCALLDGYRRGDLTYPWLLTRLQERLEFPTGDGPSTELKALAVLPALVDSFYPHYMKPNQTQEWLAESSRWILERLARPPLPNEEHELENGKRVVEGRIDSRGKVDFAFTSDNGYGRHFHGRAIQGGCGKLPRRLAQLRTSLAATRTILALREFRDTRGSLPATLDELVPSLLPRVPVDGLDGNRLHYSRAKAIVYSVGDDRKDVGGTLPERDTGFFWSLPNPAFPVPR